MNDSEIFSFQRFKFILDRSSSDIDEMVFLIENAFDVFKSLIDSEKCPVFDNYEIGKDFDTCFKYFLDEDYSLEAAESALEDLEIVLPYVFCFLDELKYIEIIKEDKTIVFKKFKKTFYGKNSFMFNIEKIFNGIKKIFILSLHKMNKESL